MRIPLIGAAYQGRSVIASAQRAINLYAEANSTPVAQYNLSMDLQAPTFVTYYPTPGTVFQAQDIANQNRVRCIYRTSKGTCYCVIGTKVYFYTTTKALVEIGTIADRPSQVYMADNGLAVVLVDGVAGYAINMVTNDFAQIVDASFYPADFVVFLDTFFVFNRATTNQFFISLSQASYGMLTSTGIANGTIVSGAAYTNGTYLNVALTGGSGTGATANITVSGNAVTVVDITNGGYNYAIGNVLSANAADIGGTGAGFTYTVTEAETAFDPLDIAAKSGSADPIVAIATVHKELWLIGSLTVEVWIGTGAADFYFQQVQGAYIQHGCAAAYSVACQDVLVFWLMQDREGRLIVVRGQGYDVSEISTPRIVEEFSTYADVSDAIGFCFQVSDHAFYCLTFPTANKTWLFDLKTGRWSEWAWMDENGNLNRSRANCAAFFNGINLIGDWENGKLLKLDPDVYTDENSPITRIRTIPHIVDNGDRIRYTQFIADMQVGTYDDQNADEPMVALSWSDDRGVSYGNPVEQSLGNLGDYLAQPSWNRLGIARDRVFKLQWSAPIKTALNGAFIDYVKMKS